MSIFPNPVQSCHNLSHLKEEELFSQLPWPCCWECCLSNTRELWGFRLLNHSIHQHPLETPGQHVYHKLFPTQLTENTHLSVFVQVCIEIVTQKGPTVVKNLQSCSTDCLENAAFYSIHPSAAGRTLQDIIIQWIEVIVVCLYYLPSSQFVTGV